MEKVAIIGMGIAGMGVLLSYKKEVNLDKVEIDLYDYTKSFGRGFPFRKDSDEVLLNARPTTISFDYEKPYEFGNWLEEINYKYDEFVPRHILGDYLNKKLVETAQSTNAQFMKSPAYDLDWNEEDNKWKITLENKEQIEYDRVHLCCGELPQLDVYDLSEYENYIECVYPLEKNLERIPKDKKVCIIGTGLSGIDLVRFLVKEKNQSEISIFSRNNVFPTARKKTLELKAKYFTYEVIEKILENNNGYISFEEFDELFNKELEYQGVNFDELMDKYDVGFRSLEKSIDVDEKLSIAQSLFSDTTNPLNLSWVGFTELDKDKFKDKYKNYLQIFGGPTPKSTAKTIVDAKESGRLNILENIKDIVFNKNTKEFDVIDKDKNVTFSADYICNATGLDKSFKSVDKENSFLGKILNKRYIQVDEDGGITVLPDKITVISPKFGEFENLHGHGVLISGVQLRNNSIPTIQETAHRLIKRLYKKD